MCVGVNMWCMCVVVVWLTLPALKGALHRAKHGKIRWNN